MLADKRITPRAASLFGTAGEASRDLQDTTTAGYAFSQQGSALFYAQEFGDSAAAYQQSADQYRLSDRGAQTARALWGQADALSQVGDYEGCLSAATESRALAESEGESDLAGRSCLQLGRSLYLLDREPEALDACKAGRNLCRQAGDAEMVANIDDFTGE